jgi:ppGpp synthetase/RelA/SpoT-type nucleotidyltranferase
MQSSQTALLVQEIESAISKHGLMFRIFFREKTHASLRAKILKDPAKYSGSKKIQDVVGIRIALYFLDDVKVASNILESKFIYLAEDSQIDELEHESFKANRCNLMFKLPEAFDLSSLVGEEYQHLVDNTFEVQFRTILSEGWHEIDHDLRYKCKEDWAELNTENRALNGVYATLETSEWTMLKLFEDIAYKHYKNKNWRAMLQNKFRLRLVPSPKDDEVLDLLSSVPDLAKCIYRYDRSRLFACISSRFPLPMTLSTIVYIINLDEIRDPDVLGITPDAIVRWWSLK